MNNNTDSWFSATKEGLGNNLVLNIIDWAVSNDQDPIDFWREHQISNDQEMSVDDMADILACEPSTYKMHVDSYYSRPFSPLTGEQVLNFCRHVKVHPADLVSADLNPNRSIPPHIYEALQIVARTSPNRDDRALAYAHIEFEKKRYASFIYSNPEIADYFKNMQRHVQAFNGDEPWHKSLKRHVRWVENNDLRLTLRRAFSREQVSYDFYDARNHAEDYHLVQRNSCAHKEAAMQFRQVANKQNGNRIWHRAVLMYGDFAQGEKVLGFIHKKLDTLEQCGFKPDRIVRRLTAMVHGLYPLEGERLPLIKSKLGMRAHNEDPIYVLCATAYSHRQDVRDAEYSVTLLRSDLQELQAFEEWQKSAQEPELFYMNYLYCNHVASRKAGLPTERAQPVQQAVRLG